jgi:hypothetical protein
MPTPKAAPSVCPAFSNQLRAIPGFVQRLRIPFSQNTSETDTGLNLPSTALVIDSVIEVTTAVAASTIDVGTLSSESGGDANGFIDGVSCASTGLVLPAAVLTAGNTVSSWTSSTYGALLQDLVTAVTTSGLTGTFNRKNYAADANTAKSISYSTSAHAIAGNIHIFYILI